MLLSGTKIGRYVVKRKLAEGGMAEIYLCAAVGPEGFEKEVVIKVVRSFLARDEAFMKMFVDEARLASRLNHANIVQIFDFAKHDDSHFIAMEYVRGVSLWDLRRRCRELGVSMPPSIVAEIGVHVARGLQYAHSLTDRGKPLGLVHRDVTPHNVLISFDGAIKLTDFGIAKASGNQTSTAAGMLKGKFAYMSPEQARGEKIDARTDVFALGIVLWEMLTGGRLFEGESDVQVLRAVQQSYISPPARLNPDVPAVLDWAVMKALERDESKRFQSALELERALQNFVLHHAKAVEDTNVGLFVSQMFKDEIDQLQQAEWDQREGTESTAKEKPDEEGEVGLSATAVVERDHSGPKDQETPRVAPSSKPRTALMPGVRPRGPLEDEDEGSAQRTDQMNELAEQTRQTATPIPSGVVLKPSFAKEVAEASRKILTEEEEAKARTTQSLRAAGEQSAPTARMPPVPDVSQSPKASPLLWIAVSLASLGFVGSLGYLMLFNTPKTDSTPIVVAPPPPAPALVVAAEPPKEAEPPRAAAPDAAPALPETPSTAPTEAKKPVPAVMGTLQIDARPFASVTLNGNPWQDEVVGIRTFSLKPGTYTLMFSHPKRTMPKRVNITPNHVTKVEFRALEAP